MTQPQVQSNPLVSPLKSMPWVDIKSGLLTAPAQQFMQQLFELLVGTSRLIPCTCTNVGNVYTLTQFGIGPLVKAYQDFDTFSFNASALSNGAATAKIVTAQGDALATLAVLTPAGAATGAAGQIANGGQYLLTFSSGLNGFVLR